MARRSVARFGWVPQLPDHRDLVYAVDNTATLPTAVDLRSLGHLSPVYDQEQLGSCTANAIAAAVDYVNHVQTGIWRLPSRLWIYFQERFIEGTVKSDSGAQIRDGIKVLANLGAPPEKLWPYVIAKFAVTPSARAKRAAAADRALTYQAVPQTLHAIKAALAAGFPVVFGFTVYESFESDEVAVSGIVPMPSHGETAIGGHAVMLIGYDDATERFKARNSWGADWGEKGYFEMPYLYVASPSLASDFWVIQTTTEVAS